MVGMSSLLARDGSKTDVSANDMILGMILIIGSQVPPPPSPTHLRVIEATAFVL
jgi:hypothetical protein